MADGRGSLLVPTLGAIASSGRIPAAIETAVRDFMAALRQAESLGMADGSIDVRETGADPVDWEDPGTYSERYDALAAAVSGTAAAVPWDEYRLAPDDFVLLMPRPDPGDRPGMPAVRLVPRDLSVGRPAATRTTTYWVPAGTRLPVAVGVALPLPPRAAGLYTDTEASLLRCGRPSYRDAGAPSPTEGWTAWRMAMAAVWRVRRDRCRGQASPLSTSAPAIASVVTGSGDGDAARR